LVLALAVPAQPFFGHDSAKITVLWVPSESFSDWQDLDMLLDRYKDLRFTIALAPEDVPPAAASKLGSWVTAGRVELALRLKGDPVLPLIADHPDAPRPQDALDRLALARESFKTLFTVQPAGFVPGSGALSPPLLEGLNAMALPWVAAAEYTGSTQSWAAMGKTVLVPCKAVQTMGADISPADLTLPDYPDPDVFVVDEADGLVPEGAWLRLLKIFADKHPRPGWQTVTESVALRKTAGWVDAFAVKTWPTWTGTAASWTSTPAAKKAWNLYGETARALEHYQNSGVAQIKTLEEATNELYEAQSARYYRLLGSPRDAQSQPADRDLRSHLLAVYRKTKQTPPEDLFLSLLAQSADTSESDADQADAGSTDVHFTRGDSWLSFENPAGSASRAPEGAPPLPDGTPAAQLWNIKSLRIDWTSSAITFVYRMARLDNGLGAPAEMGPLLLDTYVDLNHIVGAGSIELLPGHPGAVVTRDAWEYALTVSGWGAFLYRSNPLGTPLLAGRLAVTADPQSGEIRVVVPSSLLKGNPVHWGYAVAAFAVDTETTSKPPPRPAVDAKRGGILGLLAPLEQQMGLAAEGPRPRLTAIRAKSE
jgi:hypothetical protein